jgi:hypothetical protein
MAGSAGLGFSTSSGKKTGRTGSSWDPAKFTEFVKTIHNTLGGPFTIGDLFTLAPRTQGLFGGEPQSAARPGGGYNLGFGPPPGYSGPQAGAGPSTGAGPTDVTPGGTDANPTPAGGTDATPAPSGASGQLFNMSDVEAAWQSDPEKIMDLPRFFRQSGLDPAGFSLEDFQDAVANVSKYGFTGRSAGNFGRALSLLQNRTTVGGELGGGKGTGVF